MSVQLSDDVLRLVDALGWSTHPGASADETVIGDYARDYLVLQMPRYVQVARRSSRGGPSLTMWSPDEEAVQKHLAFRLGRLVRYREESGPIAVQPVDGGEVPAPFRIETDDDGAVFALWGGGDAWAGFGAGNEFAARQFAAYARGDVAYAAAVGLGRA